MRALGIRVLYNGEPEKQAPQYHKFNRGIRGIVAELESDETSQRTYKCHLYRANQGKRRGGPTPYGTQPDGHGWLVPDPATHPVLLWLLERRAENLSYHAITRMLNEGIALDGGEKAVPPTPGMIMYQRKPYLERQDPETGDVIHDPRPLPTGFWQVPTVMKICQATIDGVYAGVLSWGRTFNKFDEDADGNPKRPVRVETGKPLVPESLLRRVQEVELARQDGELVTNSAANTFLIAAMRCGGCGGTISGYTSSKTKGERKYRYRKYRCIGRVNKIGSCKMPMLSAEDIESAVLNVVLRDLKERSQSVLLDEVSAAIQRKRDELLGAIDVARTKLAEHTERRTATLDALTMQLRLVSDRTRAALAEQAEAAVLACDELEAQIRKLQLGLQILDEKARTVVLLLEDERLRPECWGDHESFLTLERAQAAGPWPHNAGNRPWRIPNRDRTV